MVDKKTNDNAAEALAEIVYRMSVRNDLDAYLHALAEWGLGTQKVRPKIEDYTPEAGK